MLSPEQIKEKALNKYPHFLRAYFAGENIFPYPIKFGRPRGAENLEKIAIESRKLIEGSASYLGYGYTVDTQVVGTRLGTQRYPVSVYFPDAENYLRAIEKEAEFAEIDKCIKIIAQLTPQAEPWARSNPLCVLSKRELWHDLCLVLNELIAHPRPGCFPRELALPVSGKLIAEENPTLCAILKTIPGEHWQEGGDFYEQLGFRKPPASFIRFRFLDDDVLFKNGWPLNDVSVSLECLAAHPLKISHVIITENLMTYLAFPSVKDALLIWGEGKAVDRVPRIPWISDRQLWYWGDIDPHGMEILRTLRLRFPDIRSFLMDIQILKKYQRLIISGNPTENLDLDGLTDGEAEAAKAVYDKSNSKLLEQEKIPQFEVNHALREIGLA